MKYLLIFLFTNLAFAGYTIPWDEDVLLVDDRSRSSVITKKNLDILVWNIYKAKRENFYKQFQIQLFSNDILLLQELELSHEFNEFLSTSLVDKEFSMSSSFLDNGVASGVGTFSAYSSRNIEWVRSNAREPIIKTPKMFQINSFDLSYSDNDLMVITIHGVNFVRNRFFNYQMFQLKKALKSHQGPLLLAGDFNTWNDQRLSYLKRITKSLNLSHVKIENPNGLKRFMGNTLDHAFVRSIEVLKARAESFYNASDHPAIKLKVKIQN